MSRDTYLENLYHRRRDLEIFVCHVFKMYDSDAYLNDNEGAYLNDNERKKLIIEVGKIPWRREWQPTPVFLPGESLGQRSLAGYSPLHHTELDMTEAG